MRPLLVLFLVGCHPTQTACEEYVALSTTCQNEALGSGGKLDEGAIAAFCERELEGATAEEKRDARDGFACATAAYEGVDCADLDAYNRASSEAAACLR